jgi:hypothetical protein
LRFQELEVRALDRRDVAPLDDFGHIPVDL